MDFWRVLGYLLASTLIYVSYRALKYVYMLFREYFVLWNVAVGARNDRRTMSAKIRLHVYVCKTDLLDEVSINELYAFGKSMVRTDISIQDFHKVVLSYKFAVMFRERKDGSLRGMLLLGIDNKTSEDGKKYTLIRIGLSLFQNYYQGGPLMYYVGAYHVLKELFWHPFTPVYLAGKAFSYKSYMVMANSLREFYPRYDTPTPDFEKSIITDFGRGVATANEVFDETTGVLKRELSQIRGHVAHISEEELKNPHIRFFSEQNPGWASGHQMCCIARVKWSDVLYVIWKALRRARRARKEGVRPTAASRQRGSVWKYSRQLSFQEESANKYAVTYYEVDVGGNLAYRGEQDGGYAGPGRAPTLQFQAQASFDVGSAIDT